MARAQSEAFSSSYAAISRVRITEGLEAQLLIDAQISGPARR